MLATAVRIRPVWGACLCGLCYLALVLPLTLARATDASLQSLDVSDQAAPVFDVYATEHGLSAEIWNSLGVDGSDFVWAGSASSLARFDGYRWQQWRVEGTGGLVRDLVRDDAGYLWALFEGDGLARYDGQAWEVRQVFPDMRLFSETRTSDGERRLWLAYGDGLARLVGGRWVPDPGNCEHTRDAIDTVTTERLLGRPLQWLVRVNDGGLWHRDILAPDRYGPWQRAALPEIQTMALNGLKRSVHHGEEELWVLSYNTGLARLSESGLQFWSAFRQCDRDAPCLPATLPTEAMYVAEVTYDADGERNFWLATRAGLVRIVGDAVSIYDRRHGLPSHAVRGLGLQQVDGIDVLWLATEGGMARTALADSPWRTVSLLGARENGTFGVLLEPDGHGGQRLWVGSARRGLGLLERGQWRFFRAEEGTLPATFIRALWRVDGPDGTSWRLIGFDNGELYRITDDLRFEPLPAPWQGRGQRQYVGDVLARTDNGHHELWIAAFGGGIHRLRDGQWSGFARPDGASAWRVSDLVEQIDAQGRSWLWALAESGLYRLDGPNWTRVEIEGIPENPGFRHGAIIDTSGISQLWIGTSRHGLLRLDVSDPQRPLPVRDGRVPAPPDPTVYSIVADSVGRIYVCTNNGVQQLLPDGAGGFESRVHTRAHGLVHDECNSNGQFVDQFDRYWAGTLGGLSVFDPRIGRTRNTVTPKPVHLTGLVVDEQPLPLPENGIVRLPPGTREIRIDYVLLAGLRESESVYRSQLIGYEDQPGTWSTQPFRQFTALSPGHYEFHVEARDHAGVAGTPARFEFAVAPFWWQRGSVHVAVVALLLLATAAAVLRYNEGLRRRQRQLRAQVASRTVQLQEANRQLTDLSYQDPLTGLANRRRLMEALSEEMVRARQRQSPVGLIIVDVDHFKPYNDHYGHVAGDVALSAIARGLQSAVRRRELVARLGGEEFACLVTDAEEQAVYAIAERMRQHVAALTPRELGNDHDHLTISAGVLLRVPTPDDDLSSLLTDCDAALYEAKHLGRNQVRVFCASQAVGESLD